ncbi:peptidoglycan DD-metalloendopeptidase family protein [Streptomyces sp. NPDC051567]|uniref:M23 family metallopeptidase n=1 Tax=Streptomyces sp. NPDC051567 TaxID=3365660 RepID=UPI0037896D93
MNDRPSPGQYPDTGYDGLSTTTFAGDSAFVSYETQGQGFNYAAYGGSYETGAYDTTAWTSPTGHPQGGPSHDSPTPADGTGHGGGPADGYLSSVPGQDLPEGTAGSWEGNTSSYPQYAEYQPDVFGHGTPAGQGGNGQWAMPGYGTTGTGTGAYDATAWNTVTESPADPSGTAAPYPYPYPTEQTHGQAYGQQGHEQGHEQGHGQAYEQAYAYGYESPAGTGTGYEAGAGYTATAVFEAVTDEGPEPVAPRAGVHDFPTQTMPATPPATGTRSTGRGRAADKNAARNSGRTETRTGASSRRRTPAKRSALLTVAVPSACVMGVAGVAAASVGGLTGAEAPLEDTTTMAAPDPASVKPVAANSKLDTQLAALSADAGDFADRASRTQERIDLHQRQEDEKKRKAEEAAAKEAARPKFAIPVTQQGLSASFGQAGGMWMSAHTGIDFPVSYGTPVMAATDGIVRTQFNSAYGNMAIVTAPDGTETWYCHLSSTKIRGGKVKAGEVIAYAGDSGNSTGPHLHFEVRPGGGSAIDPLAWLRLHGLDPT